MTLWSEKKSSESYFLKRSDAAERFVGPLGMALGIVGLVAVIALVAWLTGLI